MAGRLKKKQSTATLTMETEIVGVVGRLKKMVGPPLRQLDVNVGVALCLNGRRSPPEKE